MLSRVVLMLCYFFANLLLSQNIVATNCFYLDTIYEHKTTPYRVSIYVMMESVKSNYSIRFLFEINTNNYLLIKNIEVPRCFFKVLVESSLDFSSAIESMPDGEYKVFYAIRGSSKVYSIDFIKKLNQIVMTK